MADKASNTGGNKPPLSLHVPEPKSRPGEAVDFSDVPVSMARAASR